jgi:hypothetical protein
MTYHGYQRNTLDPFGANKFTGATGPEFRPGARGRNTRYQQG